MRARVGSLFEQGAAIVDDTKDTKVRTIKRRRPSLPTMPDPGIEVKDGDISLLLKWLRIKKAIAPNAEDARIRTTKRPPPPLPTMPDPGIQFSDSGLREWEWARRFKEIAALLKSAREQSAHTKGAAIMPDAKDMKPRAVKRPPPPPTAPDPGFAVKDGDLSLLLKWLRIKK